MKKLLFALVLGIALVLALATVASADNGPHGGFTATTDACAGCHRAHSARSGTNDLLRLPISQLCLSCHQGGLGASTDVDNGVYTTNLNTGTSAEGTVNNGLFGGGFTNAVMTTAWNGSTAGGTQAGNAGSRGVSSMHTLGAGQTVWGSGANGDPVTGDVVDLECTSCHDPHGKSGWDTSTTPDTRVASYRLLRWQPEGSNGFTAPTANNWSGGAFPVNDAATPESGWLVQDNFATKGGEWYTLGTTGSFAPNDYLPGGSTNNIYNLTAAMAGTAHDYRPSAISTGFFCAQCHDRYFNNSNLRSNQERYTSAYCAAPAPTALTDVHPTYPADCRASNELWYPYTATDWGWRWADLRPSGDNTFMYRHSSGDVRATSDGSVAQSGTAFSSAGRTCLTCHVSHGTAALADSTATDGVDAGSIVNLATIATSNVGGSLHGGSTLLRMDGRTVCIRCHSGDVNYVSPVP